MPTSPTPPKKPGRAKYRNTKVYRGTGGQVFYLKRRRHADPHTVYFTQAGEVPGPAYTGPKTKVADSVKEWRRFVALRAALATGRIQALRTQVRFWLHGPNGTRITSYVADFVYVVGGVRVVEDVKSDMTRKLATYKIKKAWMLDQYGIRIVET